MLVCASRARVKSFEKSKHLTKSCVVMYFNGGKIGGVIKNVAKFYDFMTLPVGPTQGNISQ